MALLFWEMDGPSWNLFDDWVSSEDECEWFGVECNKNGVVTKVVLNNNNIQSTVRFSSTIVVENDEEVDVHSL